jgi:sporulation protein YlmC with PRC-barrel domain
MKRDLLSTSAAIALATALTLGTGAVLAQDASETGTAVAPATAVDAESLLGRTIENADGDNVGEIDNVVIDKDGEVRYVIVGVGGFLGIGEKHVALAWEELTVSENGETVITAATKEQLEALPEHEFPADVAAGTVYSEPDDVAEQPADTTTGQEATLPEQPADSAETQTAIPEQQATAPDEPATTTDEPPMATGEETTALETAPAAGDMGIRASELVGAEVTNPQGESIGEINEVVLGADGAAQGLVIDVGGFLGVGERRVMVNWSDVTIRSEDNGTLEVATMLDKPGIESLPEYRVPAAQ